MNRLILIAKNGRNKRNYDLVTSIIDNRYYSGEIPNVNILESRHNISAKKLKDYLITEGYKLIVARLKKREKEKLSSCRFVRDIMTELNGLELKYNEGVYFVMVPQGKLFDGF